MRWASSNGRSCDEGCFSPRCIVSFCLYRFHACSSPFLLSHLLTWENQNTPTSQTCSLPRHPQFHTLCQPVPLHHPGVRHFHSTTLSVRERSAVDGVLSRDNNSKRLALSDVLTLTVILDGVWTVFVKHFHNIQIFYWTFDFHEL